MARARSASHKSVVSRIRVGVFILGILVLLGSLFTQIVVLQVVNGDEYADMAMKQQVDTRTLLGKRGDIYFRNLSENNRVLAAVDSVAYDIILSPARLTNVEDPDKARKEVATVLSDNLSEVSESDVREVLQNKTDPWVRFAKNIDAQQIEQIKEHNLSGVGFRRQLSRMYPNEELGAHVLGFVRSQNEDGQIERLGQYGVEQSYQTALQGKSGYEKRRTTLSDIWVSSHERELKQPENGDNLVLSVDQNVQYQLEKTLQDVYEEQEAKQAFGAIMNPQTGEIYAMAKQPSFNPSTYGNVEDSGRYLNPLINSRFEPGSIFKPLTMAIGLDTNSITPTTTYEDTGESTFGSATIRNVWDEPQGTQTMTEVLEKSLNTGTIFVQEQVGDSQFRKYVRSFEINQPTEIDLPAEIRGNISNLSPQNIKTEQQRNVQFATASFGKGITVTPIRMLTAFSAIVNDGVMPQPHILKKRISEGGETHNPDFTDDNQQIFSEETADTLAEMLVSVVDNGFGENAAVKGYRIGGKTGSSEKTIEDPKDLVEGNDAYSEDRTVHSFIQFASLENPKYVMLLSVDEPKGQYANRTVVAPAGELNKYLVNYFDIQPDRQTEPSQETKDQS